MSIQDYLLVSTCPTLFGWKIKTREPLTLHSFCPFPKLNCPSIVHNLAHSDGIEHQQWQSFIEVLLRVNLT